VGCDLGEENTVDGVQAHVVQVYEMVVKMTRPFEKTTTIASVLGSPYAAVGMSGRWLDWESWHPCSCSYWTMLETFRHFWC